MVLGTTRWKWETAQESLIPTLGTYCCQSLSLSQSDEAQSLLCVLRVTTEQSWILLPRDLLQNLLCVQCFAPPSPGSGEASPVMTRKVPWPVDKLSPFLLWGSGVEWDILLGLARAWLYLEGPLGCRSQQLEPRRPESVTRLCCPLQEAQWSHWLFIYSVQQGRCWLNYGSLPFTLGVFKWLTGRYIATDSSLLL